MKRSNPVYQIAYPKTMLGTDKSLASLIVLMDVMVCWMSMNWRMGVGAILLSYLLILFAQQRSRNDAWWFRLYRPYNRYADIYHPWPSATLAERYARPYGFGRDAK